ncbi:MAG TPA: chemotaxis protein CheW [Burkholderiaceae bacterium]
MSFEVLQQKTLSNNPAGPRQFLAFRLAGEEYAIDIRQVQELRGVDHVTRIANAPAYVKGVLNLRGLIVPLLDLRLKLNMEARDYDAFTVVIVLSAGARTIGVAVDSVSEVTTLEPGQIKPPPGLGGNIGMEYLLGLGTVDDHMLILVDLERLITEADFASSATLH